MASASHVKWDCKYHVVLITKYRKKKLYGFARRQLGDIFQQLCRRKGIQPLEGHIKPDHVHMMLNIPPKYSVSMAIGFIKGKSAIMIQNALRNHQRDERDKKKFGREATCKHSGLR